MFEQATLAPGPAGKRIWTTFLGMTGQVALVTIAILAPMIWPQVMPSAPLLASLVPPVPPGPPPKGNLGRQRSTTTAVPRTQFHRNQLTAPVMIPDKPLMIEEAPSEIAVAGVPSGDPRGSERGVPGAFFNGMVPAANLAPPPVAPAAPKPAPPPPEPKRYLQGGRVQLGRLIHKVEPAYPPMAKATHASGMVQLECVVGADGRMREVKVVSGNALLIRPAVDAVLQWIYEPSQLNGVPIEIVAQIRVEFKLN